jgi:predicted transcriptional regulator
MQWETTYMRLAQQAITNVAQDFTPRSFWERRTTIEKAMTLAVNRTLAEDGFAAVERLQLTSIDFQDSYEQTITNIQLQEQLRVTKQFQLQVTEVLKEVDILQAQTTARVTKTNAEAARLSAVVMNEAAATALVLEQGAKAEMYARMRSHLNWSQGQFLEYIRMKSLNSQPGANVKLGVTPVGTVT